MECKYVAIDIGGTFTDLVAYNPETQDLVRTKVLTTPSDPSNGFVGSLEKADLSLPASRFVKHGTTLAINTVIERTGARTGLITTKGFRDVLEVARGNRPTPFNLFFKRLPSLVSRDRRMELSARIAGDGSELAPVDFGELEEVVERLRSQGVEAIAVCFLNSYGNPQHEQAVIEWLNRHPDIYVTESTSLTREWREYERTSTAVVNAYVGPKLSRYIGRLDDRLKERGFEGAFFMMESNGGIMSGEAAQRAPVKLLESGPVAGAVGVAKICSELGIAKAISFDMGGTTAKCALVVDGQISTVNTYYLGGYEVGYPVLAPVVDIIEVGAGGGSIASIDALGTLKVGPRSAGAAPGPICYRRGGEEPTVTDANAVLGRLPMVGSLGDATGLDVERARQILDDKIARPLGITVDKGADGIIRLAVAIMASAVRRITIERGLDPREFTLVVTGGAGPLHAILIAQELGMDKVIIPPGPGHFSAWGMLLADIRHEYSMTMHKRLGDIRMADLEANFAELDRRGRAELDKDGRHLKGIRTERFADMRFQGQEHTVLTRIPEDVSSEDAREEVKRAFMSTYEQRFGRFETTAAVELVTLRLTAEGIVDKPGFPVVAVTQGQPTVAGHKAFFSKAEGWRDAPIIDRGSLALSSRVEGPAIIVEDGCTSVLPPGATAIVDRIGNLVCTPGQKGS
jgi:N-methylhydantoinase A